MTDDRTPLMLKDHRDSLVISISVGVYRLDDECDALARSAEDEYLGQFASDAEVDQMFSLYSA